MWASDTVYFILDYKQIIPSHVSEWHGLFYAHMARDYLFIVQNKKQLYHSLTWLRVICL